MMRKQNPFLVFYVSKSAPDSQRGREINKPPTKSEVDAESDGTDDVVAAAAAVVSSPGPPWRYRAHVVQRFLTVKHTEKRITGSRSDRMARGLGVGAEQLPCVPPYLNG